MEIPIITKKTPILKTPNDVHKCTYEFLKKNNFYMPVPLVICINLKWANWQMIFTKLLWKGSNSMPIHYILLIFITNKGLYKEKPSFIWNFFEEDECYFQDSQYDLDYKENQKALIRRLNLSHLVMNSSHWLNSLCRW